MRADPLCTAIVDIVVVAGFLPSAIVRPIERYPTLVFLLPFCNPQVKRSGKLAHARPPRPGRYL